MEGITDNTSPGKDLIQIAAKLTVLAKQLDDETTPINDILPELNAALLQAQTLTSALNMLALEAFEECVRAIKGEIH